MHADVSGSLSRANWISLRLWVFKFIDVEDVDSFGVCVEGYRPSDETETVLRNWHSTAIEKRVTPYLLHSCTGSVYELRGSIDKDLAFQYGYPAELVALFANGFPENWKSILREYFYVVKTTNPMNASYYFSTMARRRSSSVTRRIDVLSTSGFLNHKNRRSERLSILPPPTALPVAIEEEDEQKENSTPNVSSSSLKKTPKSGNNKSNACSSTPRRSSRINKVSADSPNVNATALAVTIEEEGDEQKENSTPNVSSSSLKKTPMSGNNKSNACSSTPRRSSRINKVSADSPNVNHSDSKDTAVDTLPPSPTITRNYRNVLNSSSTSKTSTKTSDKNDASSSEISFIVIAPINAKLSEKSSDAPSAESSPPCGFQWHDDDCSAGPVFADLPSNQGQEIDDVADDPQRNGNTISNDLAVVPTASDVFKVPSGQPFGGIHGNAIELSSWSIRFAPLDCGGPELGFPKFVLLGKREGHDKQWYSSLVVRVESAEILHTSSSTYRLLGDMDIIDSASAGFPKMFVAKFLRGFPPDWKTQITNLYNTFFGNLKITTNLLENCGRARPTLSFSDDSETRGPTSDQLETSCLTQDTRTSKAGCSRDNDLNNDRIASQRYKAQKGRSFINDNDSVGEWDSNAALLPSYSSSISEIRRSRSGRCSHPPLAQWAGERVRYDGFGNVIGVEGIGTATIHAKGSTGALDLSKYYGVSPARPIRQSEVYLNAPKLAVDDGPKRTRRCKALVTYSDSSNEENVSFPPKRRKPLVDVESPVFDSYQRHQCQSSTESDDSEIERELRTERHLILEQARELQRQQKNLLEMERRLAFHEKKWKKRKAQRRNIEKITEPRRLSLTWSIGERRRGKMKTERRRYLAEHGNNEHRKEVIMRDQLVKEWAREDELSSSGNSSGDVDWHIPTRKKKKKEKKKKQMQRVKKSNSSSDATSLSAEEGEDGSEDEKDACTSIHSKKPVPRKEKRWEKTELDRLKLAIAAVRVQNDEDWEKVARSLGNDRDPESCKQAAIKRLKWEPSAAESNTQVITSERITARAGTMAFQHQTNEFTRKFMLAGGAQSDDYFKNTDITANNSMSMAMLPDLTDFAADDSLLEVLHTPTAALAERKVSNRRQFLAEAIEDEESPIRRRSSAVLMETPKDSAQRERQNRYFHHLINKGGRRDVSRMNLSRIGNSTRMEAAAARVDSSKIQTFGSLHEDLDYVAKMTKKAARRNKVIIEDSEEELELDDENMDDLDDDDGVFS